MCVHVRNLFVCETRPKQCLQRTWFSLMYRGEYIGQLPCILNYFIALKLRLDKPPQS